MNNLQRTGASPAPAQPSGAQAQAFSALVNIQGATQGADERVKQAYEETIRRLQEALKQSEANNQTLEERNVQLTNIIRRLTQQNRELSSNFAIQQQEHAASLNVELERTAALKASVNAECNQIISKAQNPTPAISRDYEELTPETRRRVESFNDQLESGLNQLALHGKNIKARININE